MTSRSRINRAAWWPVLFLQVALSVVLLPAATPVLAKSSAGWSAHLRGERQPTGEEAALLVMAAEFTELRDNGLHAYRGLRTRRYTYVRDMNGPWLLYDNEADPYQMRNLIHQPSHAAIQRQLEEQLQARLRVLGDEFLDGRVYLDRAGLTHYREVNSPLRCQWRDPWAAA